VAKVASIGVAVVAVSNGSGDMGNDGVVGDLVWDEGAVVGVWGRDAGVVVGIWVSLGISLSIGLPLLASEVHEGGDLVHSAVGESNRVNHMGSGQWSVVDKGGGGVVDDRGNVMEDRVGNHLMAHLSGHLNDRLDKRGVGDSVGHGEDGSDRGNGGNCVDNRLNGMGKDGGGKGGGNRVCEKRGRVGGNWEGEGVRVCGVGQKKGGVGFRPGQAKRGHGENSKHALHTVC